ncbi:MAG: tripartite tricarboxylate transporter substrate binding protein BugD [Betaproteobacteria bacterium]|nr:tripartite tricarboxylate transporter substrate binding protein BugD [Pseudomonadota bacterium]NBO12019.1 tripartite tricarboxylate transporter substrate binding protein BugD [Betaproteobacteria bacterium]NBO44584.1 tripartite tricarboxylate transporter substrate binding protein BugD [Betaproteobacteria bacterium]NBP10714.1 tripartite tricarboxylate transporter substrate binding protein BugD [Betaproteobacteria bacterium]NBP61172.1 tripartite tricarboxylate transporter substrate binding prot
MLKPQCISTRRQALKAALSKGLSFGSLVLASGAFLASPAVQAQAYPSKPITLIVGFAAGGPTDIVARSLAQSMSKTLGQAVAVENKPGAGATIAGNMVAKAKSDGYTLLIHHNGMATAPALYRKLPFNPLTDYEYIGQAVDVPMTLIARNDLPANNLNELVSWVKANKEKVNLANAGLGAVSHLCGTLFQQTLATDLTTVPFPGTAPALTALLGGHVDVLCDQTTQTIPHINAGKVKLFGVTTKSRIGALPNTPSLHEQGLKDFEVVVWHGVYAPKGTPKPVIDTLTSALQSALKDPEVVKRMKDLGAEITPVSKQTPEGLRTHLTAEIEKWGKVIRAAGQYAD